MPEATDTSAVRRPLKVLLFANTEWFLFNFSLALAKAARAGGGGGAGLTAGAVRGKASNRRFSLGSRANGAAQPQPQCAKSLRYGLCGDSIVGKNRALPIISRSSAWCTAG